jgi:hypothetical protein
MLVQVVVELDPAADEAPGAALALEAVRMRA